MGWMNDAMSWIGKALPNEISKAANNRIVQAIPYLGQAVQIVSAADNFATGYDDVRDRGGSQGDAWGTAIKQGIGGFQGPQDPGIYGSPGNNINRDWSNMLGQSLGLLGGNVGQTGQNVMGAMNNPYFTKQEGDSIPVEGYKNQKGGFVGDFVGGFNSQYGDYITSLLNSFGKQNQQPQITYGNQMMH